jgi:hypothetical protein
MQLNPSLSTSFGKQISGTVHMKTSFEKNNTLEDSELYQYLKLEVSFTINESSLLDLDG